MFSNGNDLIIANTYYAKGKIPYKLMICSPSDLTDECYKTSILTSISSNLLLDDKNKDYIKFLANFIGQYTKHPINFIYSDDLLNKIHFARVGNDDIFKNIDGKKDYYGFFHDFYDNLIRNVIYIGAELKDNVSLEEIRFGDRIKVIYDGLSKSYLDIKPDFSIFEKNPELKEKQYYYIE